VMPNVKNEDLIPGRYFERMDDQGIIKILSRFAYQRRTWVVYVAVRCTLSRNWLIWTTPYTSIADTIAEECLAETDRMTVLLQCPQEEE